MPHRDDLEAAHARIAALERELVAARKAPLRCGRCQADHAAGDLDRASGVVTCRSCRKAVDAGAPPAVPRDIDVSQTPERLRVSWRWRLAPREIFGAFMFLAIGVGVLAIGDLTTFQVLSAISCVIVGLVYGFRVVAQLLNRTEVQVSDAQLVIESAPIALPPRRSYTRAELSQLYCVLAGDKHGVWYELHAELANGGRVRLLTDIRDVERVFYLEREIERRLAIEDRPIDGEIPRRG